MTRMRVRSCLKTTQNQSKIVFGDTETSIFFAPSARVASGRPGHTLFCTSHAKNNARTSEKNQRPVVASAVAFILIPSLPPGLAAGLRKAQI